MIKSIVTIVFVIILGLPVLTQGEKIQKIPDYTKWQLNEWDFQPVFYEGKKSHILGASYQMDSDSRIAVVYFKPMSNEQYHSLESLDDLEVEKRVMVMLSGTPLFAGYFRDGESAGDIYFYESSRKWFEIYRFWQSKFRFVGKVTESESERFIEERYKIKFIHD